MRCRTISACHTPRPRAPAAHVCNLRTRSSASTWSAPAVPARPTRPVRAHTCTSRDRLAATPHSPRTAAASPAVPRLHAAALLCVVAAPLHPPHERRHSEPQPCPSPCSPRTRRAIAPSREALIPNVVSKTEPPEHGVHRRHDRSGGGRTQKDCRRTNAPMHVRDFLLFTTSTNSSSSAITQAWSGSYTREL